MRRVSDIAQVGLVLSGTERLQPMLRDPGGRFGQISSRVNFWPPLIKSINKKDCKLLTQAIVPAISLSNEVVDSLYEVCDGSARVLRNLLHTINDYLVKRDKPVTPTAIEEAGYKIMDFKPRHRCTLRGA